MPQIGNELAFGIITEGSRYSTLGSTSRLSGEVERFGDVSVPAHVENRGWIETTELK
jgi:hypothetical protein